MTKQKRKTEAEELDVLVRGCKQSYAEWDALYLRGGNDPFWADGVNLGLVRNHIIYFKREIEKLCSHLGREPPEIVRRELPPEVPNDYMDIAGKYSEKERMQFAEMSSFIILALEDNPEQDFLGGIYNELNLCDKRLGQVLTPYSLACSICNMEQANLVDLIREKHIISVADPCCSPGCLLIAYANEARKKDIDFQNRILFVGQEIDRTAALMGYIQLSLLGCAAYIKVGNSLTDPLVYGDIKSGNVWFTPYYFSDI